MSQPLSRGSESSSLFFETRVRLGWQLFNYNITPGFSYILHTHDGRLSTSQVCQIALTRSDSPDYGTKH